MIQCYQLGLHVMQPTGIGVVLSHVMPDGSERPVAFSSRSLTKTERKYAQIDKEALSIVWGVKRFHVYLYGRRFTLITDHKPLTAIFHPEKGVPAMTAARLQRYALLLAGFDYKIEYKSTTEHCNADGLFRLPLQQKELEEMGVDSSEMFHATQFASLPVTSEAVSRETRRDPVLARVHESIVKGWSARVDGDKPYYERRNELTVHQGCILLGMRVVIPNKLQDRVMEELHDRHMGVVKMKALAKSYVWRLISAPNWVSSKPEHAFQSTSAFVGVGHCTMATHTHRLCRPVSELHVFSGCRCTQQVAGGDSS